MVFSKGQLRLKTSDIVLILGVLTFITIALLLVVVSNLDIPLIVDSGSSIVARAGAVDPIGPGYQQNGWIYSGGPG